MGLQKISKIFILFFTACMLVVAQNNELSRLPHLLRLLLEPEQNKLLLPFCKRLSPESKGYLVLSLIKVLKQKHYLKDETILLAIQTLGEFGEDASIATPALVDLLEDYECIDFHLEVIKTLGKIKPDKNLIVPALIFCQFNLPPIEEAENSLQMLPKKSKEPWYLGHECEYKGIIKPELPKEQLLKEQRELKQPPYLNSPFMIDKEKFPIEWKPEELSKEVEQNIKYFKDKPWLKILHKIGTMTQEEINAAVEKQDQEEKILYKHVIKVPEKLPGLFVDFKGSIVRIRRKEFLIENPYGIKELWEGQIYDRDYRLISFQLLDPPVDLFLWDAVSIRGVFYKNWVFEDTQGNLKATPLIVGRKLLCEKKLVDLSEIQKKYLKNAKELNEEIFKVLKELEKDKDD